MRLGLAAVAVAALAVSLGCGFGSEGGERADGQCPADETCSDVYPNGLEFVSFPPFEEEGIGTLAVGGTMELGYADPQGDALARHLVELQRLQVLDIVANDDLFGASESSTPRLDDWVTLAGLEDGTEAVRVLEPGSLDLFDRIGIDARSIDRVELGPAFDAGRTELVAGCEEFLAVRIFDADGGRLVDHGLSVSSDGVGLDLWEDQWDVVIVNPDVAGTANFRLRVAGEIVDIQLDVLSADEAGACP